MPAPRLLPDTEVILALRKQGFKTAEIAAMYGVSEQGVYMRLRAAGKTTPQPSYKHLKPWRVKREHTFAFPNQMLRYLGQRQNGEELAPPKRRALDRWLKEIKDLDVVVCYEPGYPPNPASPKTGGFYYSRRRPEDGESIVRLPIHAARGEN